MNQWKWIGIVVALVATASCKEKPKKEDVVAPAATAAVFKPVAIPMTYTDQQQRAEYLAAHFWDNLDFTDTAFIHLPAITEAFGVYAGVLGAVPKAKAAASVEKTWKQASKEKLVLRHFATLFENFLYDPNSPYMNEDLYITILELTTRSDAFEEEEKMRAEHRIEMALKNRMGTPAADFSFTLASGEKRKLYGIKSDYILLFFNNPGCHACKMFRDEMCASPLLTGLLREGRIKVIAVYPDEDLTEWRNYLPHIPAEWINGYDEKLELRGKKRYNLRAIPTLYLLDKNKTVLLKDARFGLVEQYLAAVTAPPTGGQPSNVQ
jgi:thiol-disulfide isomerase/thioredoxin